jgi:hypothetical protein
MCWGISWNLDYPESLRIGYVYGMTADEAAYSSDPLFDGVMHVYRTITRGERVWRVKDFRRCVVAILEILPGQIRLLHPIRMLMAGRYLNDGLKRERVEVGIDFLD